MVNIEHKVIEMLEAGLEPTDIAKAVNLTVDQVLDIEDYACENRNCDEDYGIGGLVAAVVVGAVLF